MIEDVIGRGSIFALLAERGDRGPVGGCADEDLEDVFWVDFSVLSEIQGKCADENVDEKVKKLVLVDFTVRWLGLFGHNLAKLTFQHLL